MLVENSDDQMAADPSLLRIIARAHDIQARLLQNTKLTVHAIARKERVTAAYIYTLLRLPWLAPDITTAIVNGRQPPQLNAMKLMRLTARLPSDWTEQRALRPHWLAGVAGFEPPHGGINPTFPIHSWCRLVDPLERRFLLALLLVPTEAQCLHRDRPMLLHPS